MQLADEDHRRAFDARDRFGRGDVASFAQPRGCLQLGSDEQQVGSDPAEAILERDAVNRETNFDTTQPNRINPAMPSPTASTRAAPVGTISP
jgi:hypothetical protein